jgi:Pyruvate/2-oxoacid:ferredoxin oxidoreductase gamma subunit
MNLFGGFKNKGIMIFNSKKHPKEIKKILQEKRYGYGVPQRSYQIFTVDAFSVARQILKRPIVNTAMLAATSKVTSLIPSEYIKQAINLRFPEDKEINNILFQKIQSMLLGPEGE